MSLKATLNNIKKESYFREISVVNSMTQTISNPKKKKEEPSNLKFDDHFFNALIKFHFT
jgi:hypothetical protein